MKYCPKCRTEYEDWVKLCVDCKIQLVAKLPPEEKPKLPEENPEPPEEKPDHTVNYVKIYSTHSQTDIDFLKSLLETNGIEYFVTNENISQFIPGLGQYSEKEVMIPEDEVEEAKKLLKEFLIKNNKHPSKNTAINPIQYDPLKIAETEGKVYATGLSGKYKKNVFTRVGFSLLGIVFVAFGLKCFGSAFHPCSGTEGLEYNLLIYFIALMGTLLGLLGLYIIMKAVKK